MKTTKELFDEIFQVSNQIRYIAICLNDSLAMKQKADLTNASSNESDKYEELLVNPTLIKLASQRGNIDCGGLQYLIIRYGNFSVFLIPCNGGHINPGIELTQKTEDLVDSIMTLLKKNNLK